MEAELLHDEHTDLVSTNIGWDMAGPDLPETGQSESHLPS